MSEFLEIPIVAQKLSVSESTVKRMIKDPSCDIVGVRIYRAAIRITRDSFDKHLKKVLSKSCQ